MGGDGRGWEWEWEWEWMNSFMTDRINGHEGRDVGGVTSVSRGEHWKD